MSLVRERKREKLNKGKKKRFVALARHFELKRDFIIILVFDFKKLGRNFLSRQFGAMM